MSQMIAEEANTGPNPGSEEPAGVRTKVRSAAACRHSSTLVVGMFGNVRHVTRLGGIALQGFSSLLGLCTGRPATPAFSRHMASGRADIGVATQTLEGDMAVHQAEAVGHHEIEDLPADSDAG